MSLIVLSNRGPKKKSEVIELCRPWIPQRRTRGALALPSQPATMPRRRHRHALLGAVLLACGCQAIGATGSDESNRQNAALAAVEAGSDIVKHKGTAAQAAKAAALAAASKGGNARVVMKAAYASATTAVIVNGGTAEEAGKAAVDAVLAAGGEASNAQEAFLSAFRAARKAGLPRGGNVSILCMPLLTEPIVAFSSRA